MHLLMDGANETRQLALDLGFIPVVPPLRTRVETGSTTAPCTNAATKSRPVPSAQGLSRIFSRFEKLDIMFTAFISFALIADGLRLC